MDLAQGPHGRNPERHQLQLTMPRRTQEWTLSLDASELVWGDLLDEVVDPHGVPWDALLTDSGRLTATGHAAEELFLLAAVVRYRAADRARVEVDFGVLTSVDPERVGTAWSQTLHLVATPCPFGGRRWWFECRGEGCGKRRAKLYRPGLGWWACRECYGLTYTSRGRYSSRTRRSNGWGSFGQAVDRNEAQHRRRERANFRRSLSRGRPDHPPGQAWGQGLA